VNHRNDNPGYYTCDCVPPNDPCLEDAECVVETTCPDSDGLKIERRAEPASANVCQMCSENHCLGNGACLLIEGGGEFTCEIDPHHFTSQSVCDSDYGHWCENCEGRAEPAGANNCVNVNHRNDNPGYYTCDCVPPSDPCLEDAECVVETKCPDSDGLKIDDKVSVAHDKVCQLCSKNHCLGNGACLLIETRGRFTCEIDPDHFSSQAVCVHDYGHWCENCGK